MDVLLLYPGCLEARITDDDIKVPPIGLYWVGAAAVAAGHRVTLLNLHDTRCDLTRTEALLRECRPRVIGFSILHANRWPGIEIARLLKTLHPEATIVFGGPGAGFLWETLLRHVPVIDYIVVGEGEGPFVALLACLEKGNHEAVKAIPGLACRRGETPFLCGLPAPVEDLDALPLPAENFSYAHIASSRGCPFACRFCGSPRLWGQRVRFRSPTGFLREWEALFRKGIRFFYVSDDTFTLKPARVIAICKGILERGLAVPWVAISHVRCVEEEVLYWMRRAGCIQISFGVESGSATLRRHLGKEIEDREIARAFSLTSLYGILPRAYFIYGSPGETEGTIRETVALMERIRPLAAMFHVLTLFPGTALYEEAKTRLEIEDSLWLNRIEDIPYFEVDPSLSQETVLAFGRHLREAFYERLPGFADAIALCDREDLYPFHADFLSRLAMTFSHGEYAGNTLIPGKEDLAERLYRRSLSYAMNSRACLGLGILLQKKGRHEEALNSLWEGVRRFPREASLSVAAGVSLMNLGRWQEALEAFEGVGDPLVSSYRERCRQKVNQGE